MLISYETANRIATEWLSGKHNSISKVMEVVGLKTKDQRNMYRYRREAEKILNIELPALNKNKSTRTFIPTRTERIESEDDLSVMIFSDAHFTKEGESVAFKGFCAAIKKEKPDIIINLGDSMDCASIGRFPRIGWEQQPTVQEELEVNKERLDKIRKSSPNSKFYWTLGNHDIRFENYISNNASKLEGVFGTMLSDHFPDWFICNSLIINNIAIFKHSFKGGAHAAYNNTLHSGMNIFTGHTHRCVVRPFTDYRGVRYGVECGTIADILSSTFYYVDDNPVDWQPGFIGVNFFGDNLCVDTANVVGDKVIFRGKQYV